MLLVSGLNVMQNFSGQISVLKEKFYKTLIFQDRYLFFLEGFKNTISIALVACIIGIIIGAVVALVKIEHHYTGRRGILNKICNLYLTIIRGTPVVLQLMIMFYIIFVKAPLEHALYVAMLTFGINSGAYVAEIIRAGILSIDQGQVEAGRSLGLSYGETMRIIILPQAIKNVIPPLFNEFITLLKETSVAGYVTVTDLTRAAEIVRTRTFDAFFPLIVVALVYLILVVGLGQVQAWLEKSLAKSD